MDRSDFTVLEGGKMDKKQALEQALAQIDKNFGKGSIMRLGANEKLVDIEAISTGSLGLDIALGIGGLPKGRIIEIYGPESSGKTTLALQVVAEAQKKGGICGFIDAEHAIDPQYARKLGVKVEDLLISQPDTGEQALEIAIRWFGRVPLMCSSLTPLRRSRRKPNSKAKWAIACRVCRRA